MKANILVLALIALLALCLGAQAKDIEVEKLPGYIDLGKIEVPADAEEVVEVDLGPALLRLASQADEDGQDELSQLLSRIYSIRVKSFSMEDMDTDKVQAHIKEIEDKLERDKWHKMVHVKDRDEFITVRAIHKDDLIAGLMIMAFEADDHAAFVNVVGDIDLALIVKFLGGMDDLEIDIDLDDLIEEMEEQKEKGDI
jgi:hypothetical protein